MRNKKGQFLKGHQPTFEEKQKICENIKKSWKDRGDYIGDLIEKEPYIYNSWRGLMFTKKGKKNGISEEWKNFKTFFYDVYPSYQKGYTLQRKDKNFPFSNENFMWISRKEAAMANNGLATVLLECNGEKLTLYEWSLKLNKTYNSLRARYSKFKDTLTTEEILFGKKIKRGSKKTSDWKYSNQGLRAKASKLVSQYRRRDLQKGMEVCDFDKEWFIENIMTKKCTYCGDTEEIGADRIDNSIGHIKSNVIPCCKTCNHARNDNFSHEEMLELGKTIAQIKSKRILHKKEQKHSIDELNNYQKRRYNPFIYQYDRNLNLVYVFDSVDEVIAKTSFKRNSILAACRGQRHNTHNYMGFLWYYEKI